MEPRPDDLLAQGVLERSLLTLRDLQSCLREVDVSRPLIDVLVDRHIASREKLREILVEERAAIGSGKFPAEVVAMLGKPDARLGRYVRIAVIGRGGGGTVWRAWDLETQRVVAIKMLAEPGFPPTRLAMREARVAAQLSHPHIVPVFEVREDRDAFDREVHYIVMAWIDGFTLDQKAWDVREALAILRDAALAIQAAHDQGIIHRDLKPGNIIVDKEGRAYVMDFGLAKPVSGLIDTATRSGLVLGTPNFMAPEQALGQNQDLTPQADVYGLGATLYAVVCGVPPFEAESPLEICQKVVAGEFPAPRTIRANLPVDIERIIFRAMAKDRARRYRTAKQFAADIDRVLQGGHILADEEMLRIQGVAALREGRLEEAVQCFRELKRAGAEALAAARKAIGAEAEKAEGIELGLLDLALGVIATLDASPGSEPCRRAEETFLGVIARDADSEPAHLGAGVAQVLRSRFPEEAAGADAMLDRALEHFTKASHSVALRASAMHGRAIVKFYQARRSTDARKTLLRAAILDFEHAVTADPAFAHALKDLGVAKLALSKADTDHAVSAVSEAVQHFTRALEVKPDLESALYERGRAYSGLGRHAEAIDDWTKCLAIAPSRAPEIEALIRESRAKIR